MKWYHALQKPRTIFSSFAALCICFYAYTIVTAPPTIEATNLQPISPPVISNTYPLRGTVSPSSELIINDTVVTIGSNGQFSYDVPLIEGNNTVIVSVTKNGKSVSRTYSVYRYTEKELAFQEDTLEIASEVTLAPEQSASSLEQASQNTPSVAKNTPTNNPTEIAPSPATICQQVSRLDLRRQLTNMFGNTSTATVPKPESTTPRPTYCR